MSSWAKMAADLDSNPKVRKAGRDAREIFLFLLRRNAALDLGGRIPGAYVDAWYLADQLMMSEQEAMSGLSRCVRTGLLREDEGHWVISGWDDEWAKRPLTEAERKRRSRAKPSNNNDLRPDVTKVSGHESDNRDCPECHVGEEKRGEEEDVSGKPDPVLQLAQVAIAEINRLAKTAYRAEAKSTLQDCKVLSKRGVTSEQIVSTIRARQSWLDDDKMAQYFRPSTLLRPNKLVACLEDLEARKPKRREPTPDEPPEITGLLGEVKS